MIFIGPNLGNSNAHFVTNVIESIGTCDDLIIDVLEVEQKGEIFLQIRKHLKDRKEEYIIYNAKEDEDFFLSVGYEFPDLKIIIFFSDDEWRHSNYDRYLALFSDYFTVAVKNNIEKYKSYGLGNVFYMRWGCNPKNFYPVKEKKKYDVTFIGAAYGNRIEYIRFLMENDFNIRVFGCGWDNYKDLISIYGGCPNHSEMLAIIGQSKINLNFIWTSRHPAETTIKGRTLEIAACNAFQLSNYTDEFNNYGFIGGENIGIFDTTLAMAEKVNYYLEHKKERERIAQSAYKHVTTSLTWTKQFGELFRMAREESPIFLPHYKVLVINKRNVSHCILPNDERLDIKFCGEDTADVGHGQYDGVIELAHDSSIDNNGLYMMAFGLLADNADLIAANFYVKSKSNRYWIRFRDRLMERKRALLQILPAACMMFSGAYAAEYGCVLKLDMSPLRISYIEYPSFLLKLPCYKSRKLRLYFGFHRNPRRLFKEYIRELRIGKALSLGADKMWQRLLQNVGRKDEAL